MCNAREGEAYPDGVLGASIGGLGGFGGVEAEEGGRGEGREGSGDGEEGRARGEAGTPQERSRWQLHFPSRRWFWGWEKRRKRRRHLRRSSGAGDSVRKYSDRPSALALSRLLFPKHKVVQRRTGEWV